MRRSETQRGVNSGPFVPMRRIAAGVKTGNHDQEITEYTTGNAVQVRLSGTPTSRHGAYLRRATRAGVQARLLAQKSGVGQASEKKFRKRVRPHALAVLLLAVLVASR